MWTYFWSVMTTLLIIVGFMVFTPPNCGNGLVPALSSPQMWECVIKPDRKMTIYYQE